MDQLPNPSLPPLSAQSVPVSLKIRRVHLGKIIVIIILILLIPAGYYIFWHYFNLPQNISLQESKSSVTLRWESVKNLGLSYYEILRSETADENKFVPIVSKINENTFVDKDVKEGKTYFYAVRSVGLLGLKSKFSSQVQGSWSNPAYPQGLKAYPQENGIKIEWNKASDSDVVGYNVFRSISKDRQGEKINSNLIIENSLVDENPGSSWLFYYSVQSVDKNGNEGPISSLVDSRIKPPNNLVIEEGKSSVLLKWDPSPESTFEFYKISRSSSGEAVTLIKNDLKDSSYKDLGAKEGVIYRYSIKAVDKYGNESDYSQIVDGHWALPKNPTDLIAYPGGRLVKLEWSSDADADTIGFNIYRKNLVSEETLKSLNIQVSTYRKLNSDIISQSNYTDQQMDEEIKFGVPDFEYDIKSVDQAGNESKGYAKARVWPTYPYIERSSVNKSSVNVGESFNINVNAYSEDGFESIYWVIVKKGLELRGNNILGTRDGKNVDLSVGYNEAFDSTALCGGIQKKCEYNSSVTVKEPGDYTAIIEAQKKATPNDPKGFTLLGLERFELIVK